MTKLDFINNQELCSDSIIVIKDKNSCSIRFNNPDREQVYKVKVDGGLVSDRSHDNLSRCDYILYSDKKDNTLALFIELKGKNLEGAMVQLESTIKLTSYKFRNYLNKKAYISSNSSPKTQFQKKQRAFMKKNKMPLYVCHPKDANALRD